MRATGRAVCLAFARALERYGVPDEVLTDNGKQFTARFGRGGEVLFDRICRDNGIVHRLTQPATPTTTGKVERFHQTLRRDLLADHEPFADLEDVQATLDDWVEGDYNTRRPHRSLDMASPAIGSRRSLPPNGRRCLSDFRRPWPPLRPARSTLGRAQPALRVPALVPGAVEFDRVVPRRGTWPWRASSSGWDRTGPGSRSRSGPTTTSSTCSSLGPGSSRSAPICPPPDLERHNRHRRRPAGPPPMPAPEGDGAAVEIDQVVSAGGTVGLGGRVVLAAEILGGRRVTIRIDGKSMVFFDPETELLRTRPSPFTHNQATRFHGARPAGPHPGPRSNRSGSSAGPPTAA